MQEGPILLFDGVCNLCNGAVQFLLKRDARKILRFSSLQSEAARALLDSQAPGREFPDSMILFEGGLIHTESTAALRLGRILGGLWSWPYYLLIWIPPGLRNWVYRIVATNRYRWFGKRDQCLLPSPEYQKRFLS